MSILNNKGLNWSMSILNNKGLNWYLKSLKDKIDGKKNLWMANFIEDKICIKSFIFIRSNSQIN